MHLERLQGEQFQRFSTFIYNQCGIRIDEKKVTLLSNRIRRRLQARDCVSFDAYYQLLTSPDGAGELGHFLDSITTNETFFFRTPKQFDWLATELIPQRVADHRSGHRPASLRIWSAGCATGAEPYSIAIKLLEAGFRLRDWSLDIVGTDLSEHALGVAREGIYAERLVDSVSAKQRNRFFQSVEQGSRWRVRDHVRDLVHFQQHNLLQPLRDAPFDCIFLRNVLIYFDNQSKRAVVNNMLRALAPQGYLIVGPTEGVYDLLHDLRKITPLIYQRVGTTPRDPRERSR